MLVKLTSWVPASSACLTRLVNLIKLELNPATMLTQQVLQPSNYANPTRNQHSLVQEQAQAQPPVTLVKELHTMSCRRHPCGAQLDITAGVRLSTLTASTSHLHLSYGGPPHWPRPPTSTSRLAIRFIRLGLPRVVCAGLTRLGWPSTSVTF